MKYFVIFLCLVICILLEVWYVTEQIYRKEKTVTVEEGCPCPCVTGNGSSRDIVFQLRKDYIIDVCASKGRPVSLKLQRSEALDKLSMDKRHNILYCAIPKVASNFWRRMLAVIQSHGRFSSPYALGVHGSSNITRLGMATELLAESEVRHILDQAKTMIVVREPYSRLFSGYADKLYNPNGMFVKLAGEPTRRMIGNPETGERYADDTTVCGHDVTFAEFVKYILHAHENDLKINTHFSPMYEHCDPCMIRYDYVIKIETFKADTFGMIEAIEQRFGSLNISFSDFEKDTALDIAKLHINLCFGSKLGLVKKCNATDHYFLLKTWRWLQMTGVLPKYKEMPFPAGSAGQLVTKQDYIDAVAEILVENHNKTALKLQRREAFLQAYSTVPVEDLRKLRLYLLPDFQYFQYDDTPTELFDRGYAANDDRRFDYFDAI